MKVINIGEPQVIMSNPYGTHQFFAWPTITRLQNGKLAVVASGFRLRHVCPFGKMVISYSDNDGVSYTPPAPVIDTPLDDRDGGILAYGEKNVMVTSFNNSIEFQRNYPACLEFDKIELTNYEYGHFDRVSSEDEKRYLGVTYRISEDGGYSFGDIKLAPVSSPHGPCELHDGSVLWVGRLLDSTNDQYHIQSWKMTKDGRWEQLGVIENIADDDGEIVLSCEPHAIVLKDGRILVHIRVQRYDEVKKVYTLFNVYQSESTDGGKTWTKPVPVNDRLAGSPPHLYQHSSGMLICSYCMREEPFTIRVMLSKDEGKTWDVDHDIYINNKNNEPDWDIGWDIGYPATVECADGSLLTVFYAHPDKDEPAVILQQRWRFEE